jgi:hypothetical protein
MNGVLSPRKLAQIQKHDFTKELRDFEYETKFDIQNKKLGSLEILKKILSCFDKNQRFILCEVKGGDKLLTRVAFFFGDNTEYSLFRYRGARMVKVKKHKIIKGTPFKIFKNDEQLIIDKDDFSKKLNKVKHRFKRHNYKLINLDKFLREKSSLVHIGEMVKNRVKDFVLDATDGRIYAVAITFCKSKNKIQKQLEIEYAGYLPGFEDKKRGTEKQVIAGVQNLSKHIHSYFPKMLRSSVERKFEFVKRVSPEI